MVLNLYSWLSAPSVRKTIVYMGPFSGAAIKLFCKGTIHIGQLDQSNQYHSNFFIREALKTDINFHPFLSNREFDLQTINTWKR